MPVLPGHAEHFAVPIAAPKISPGAYRVAADLTCRASTDLPGVIRAEQAGHLDATLRWMPDGDAAAAIP
jgi:hypothetical protein